MTDEKLNELRLGLEFIDGSMRAQLVVLRALLRENPKALDNVRLFLENGERNGFNLKHSEEQDIGLISTLRQLCS